MSQPSTSSPSPRLVVAGGLGSGKSTVAGLLAAKGAVVIEADRIGHEVLAPGGAAFGPVAERWPHVVVGGSIDRRLLAAVVFGDADELAELEAITHPAISAEIRKQAHAVGDQPVVLEVPVPAVVGPGWIWIVVVADSSERVARAVGRGMDEADARRRIASQLSDEGWRARATHVIVNDGTLEELSRQVDVVWEQVVAA